MERLKRIWMKSLLFLVLLCLLRSDPTLAAFQGEKVIESTPVAYGLAYEKRSVTTGGGQVLIYVLKADLTNQYLKINTLVGSDGTLEKNARVTDMAVSAGSVAAVNADFFQMGESGRPIGMTYKDGRMITSPPLSNDMLAWGITENGIPVIDLFSFSGNVITAGGKKFPLSGINKPFYQANGVNSHENALLMYNPNWGKLSRGKLGDSDNVTEVFVNSGKVEEIRTDQPGKLIPENGFVLAGRGKAADFIKASIKKGENITVDYTVTPDGNKIRAGTGGWSLLVDKGKVMGNFPADINGPNARTAIGYSPDKKKLFVLTVEKSINSKGFTLAELAEYMVSMGVDRALNLDGGGSTTLALRPLGEEKPVLINKPQKDTQRFLPTALGFFSSAPKGKLSGIIIKGPDAMLPGDSFPFKIAGYDSNYNPSIMVQEKVAWQLSGTGTLEKNLFTSKSKGIATISATYEGLRGTKTVRVLGGDDFKQISSEPSSIVIRPGKTADIKIKTTGTDGTVYELLSNNYTAVVDPVLGTLLNGLFKASGTAGSGSIKIVFEGLSLSIPVSVEAEDQPVYKFTPGLPGGLTLGALSMTFGGDAFKTPLTLNASYGGELSAPIPGRYKSISAVRVQVGEGSPSVLESPAAVTWKYQPESKGRMAIIQFSGGAWKELPSRVIENNRVFSRTWELGPMVLVREENPPAGFNDMSGHWAKNAVSRLYAGGIVSGYPGNKFDPSRQVTRAEFAVLVCKTMGWQPVQGELQLSDRGTIPEWARGYVYTAVNRGVISGYEDKTFRPSRQLTRAEMASLINKALSLSPSESIRAEKTFADGGSIDSWALNPISAVFAAGLMKGDNENKFRPIDSATRAECAVLLDNVLNYLLK